MPTLEKLFGKIRQIVGSPQNEKTKSIETSLIIYIYIKKIILNNVKTSDIL